VVLATKFGNLGGRGGKFADGRPEFVIASCETSLKRLGVEVIDLYYQHRIDPAVPIEDTVGAMARLVQQGKVRALGLSEASSKNDPPRPCGASDRGGAERVLAVVPGRSRRDAAHHARA
jgi:aryl-alcohol dehydrogenase-like predicted oxidoreductase